MKDARLGPCTLEGTFVRLEPLRQRHTKALTISASRLDWGWSLHPLRSKKDLEARVEHAIEAEKKHDGYIFAVVLKGENRAMGSTSYFGIAPEHRRAEIGYTWYEQDLWGTVVNPECKLLLLQHAFNDWRANRIQLSTDIKNVHSQKAILKIGATFEGKLRNHAVRPDGTIRDTLVYSITSSEWPSIQSRLRARVAGNDRLG